MHPTAQLFFSLGGAAVGAAAASYLMSRMRRPKRRPCPHAAPAMRDQKGFASSNLSYAQRHSAIFSTSSPSTPLRKTRMPGSWPSPTPPKKAPAPRLPLPAAPFTPAPQRFWRRRCPAATANPSPGIPDSPLTPEIKSPWYERAPSALANLSAGCMRSPSRRGVKDKTVRIDESANQVNIIERRPKKVRFPTRYIALTFFAKSDDPPYGHDFPHFPRTKFYRVNPDAEKLEDWDGDAVMVVE